MPEPGCGSWRGEHNGRGDALNGSSPDRKLIGIMETLREFLHMGGYAFYVWSAYGVTFIVLAANVVAPVLRARELRARLARQARMDRQP